MSTHAGLLLAYGLILRSVPGANGDNTTLSRMIRDGISHEGLRIVRHGDDEMDDTEAGYFLVIAGTVKRTAVPHPIELTSRRLEQVTDYDIRLKSFAKKHKLKTKGKTEPGWVVAATLG